MDSEYEELTPAENEEQPEIFAVSQDEEKGMIFNRRDFIGMAGTAVVGTAFVARLGGSLISPSEDPLLQRATPTPTGAACTLRTDNPRVSVRVGPGLNRSRIRWLPVDEDIEIIGQGKDSTGADWWKIDLPEIREAWVAFDADITLSGDCDAIGQVNAPPVRPGNTGSGNGNNTGAGTPTVSAPAGNPGTVPEGQTGINYTVNGTTYTLPCGSPIPAGAVCVCNCVSVPAAAPACPCDVNCSCDGYCSCDAQGSHYWYPN